MKYFVPQKAEKEVISIRLPSSLLKTIDKKSAEADMSRNEFINQCISFAISHLPDKNSGAYEGSCNHSD